MVTKTFRCPECNATIGGGGHRLRDDNAVATEMDGSTRGAWSERQDLDAQFARNLQQDLNAQFARNLQLND